jgi:hypothetical protein
MSNEKRFSYFLVAALAASFSADASAQDSPDDLLEREPEGEWRPATVGSGEAPTMIETSNGWGVEIDRVRYHGEGFDVELQARGRLDDMQLVLRSDDARASEEVRDVAGWLEHNLSGGDRLYRRMDAWSFRGKLYAPGVDGKPGDRAVQIEGQLPLDVEVVRDTRESGVVVELSVPGDHFEVDWSSFRERLKGEG